MRDIVLKVTIEFELMNNKKQIEIAINVIQELQEQDVTLADYIISHLDDYYMQENYCSCGFNESQNYCDCGCGDFDYEYKIINIETEYGGEI